MSKTTIKQALAIYDGFCGTLRRLNGGTVDENVRQAPWCYQRLLEWEAQAREAIANPSKLLLKNRVFERLTDIPARTEAFRVKYDLENVGIRGDCTAQDGCEPMKKPISAGAKLQAMRRVKHRVCAQCGNEFTSLDPRAKFCGKPCKRRALYLRKKAKS